MEGIERLENVSPDTIGTPQTLVDDMATKDQGPVQPTPRDSLPELIGQQGPATQNQSKHYIVDTFWLP